MENGKTHLGKTDRALKILEYLKEYTDSEHRVSQKDIRAVPGMEVYVGDKHFFHNLILGLALSLNYDEDGIKKPIRECRILFDDFDKMPDRIADMEGGIGKLNVRTSHIYYNHPFSKDEVSLMLEALSHMETAVPGECEALMDKVKQMLASSHYEKNTDTLPVVHEFDAPAQNRARASMEIIGQAIRDKVRIAFRMGYYDHSGKLCARDETVVLSPYYLVSYHGRYYVWGAVGKSYKIRIFRIDLMVGLKIPERDEEKGKKGMKAEPKSVLEKRYRKWDDKLMAKHPGMKEAYSGGTYIRVHCPKKKGKPKERINEDYTFLHDLVGGGYYFRGMNVRAIDYDVFHVDGDVMEAIKENGQIFKNVSKISEAYLEKVIFSGWHGWDDWYGNGGQAGSPPDGEKQEGSCQQI